MACSLDHEQAGDLSAAAAVLVRWLTEVTEEFSQTQEILPDAVRLAVRTGDLDIARKLTALAQDSAETWQTLFIQGNARYCHGLLANDGALLRAAADHYQRAGRPLPRAKALEAAAAAYAHAGAAAEAQAAHAEAAETYATLGVTAPPPPAGAAPASAATTRSAPPVDGQAVCWLA
jgi:hypothetical protein